MNPRAHGEERRTPRETAQACGPVLSPCPPSSSVASVVASPGLRLVPVGQADAARLAELGARTFRQTFEAHNTAEDLGAFLAETYGEDILRAELADRATTVVFAEVDGVAVGYAHLRPGPPEPCVTGDRPLELARIYVDRAHHGSGVARALMDWAIAEAARQGARTLWLGVWEHNARAQAFYRKFGFTEVGEHPFRVGREVQRDLILARPLP